jgi:hypothetical protein
MPFKGFFELLTPQDLFAKLERDLIRVQSNPLDVDSAFDFFATAYHLLDWLYPGNTNKHRRAKIENDAMLLQVASHLANGSKHFEATAPKHKSVERAVSRPGPFQMGAFQADAFDVGELVVHLGGNTALHLGTSISVVELAGKLVGFWRQELR